jgi:signal transduction histidine kinase
MRLLRDTAQESLREMRLLIFELRPVALEKNTLEAALRSRLESVEERSGIKTELQVQGEGSLPYRIRVELYQIAQEALNNALKHAHPGKITVSLHFAPERVRLEVRDDGCGFVPEECCLSGGMGLASMQERASKLGGRLEVSSAPGQGACVSVEVDLSLNLT